MPDAQPTLQPPIIRATGLCKHFGAHAVVQDVSFELAAGETLVLLGPSGCGKTTLLKMLNRLLEPDAGTVEINGEDVQTQRSEALRRGIGYVIQQVGLLPHYTVAENVAVVPHLLGHAPAAIAERTTALLARLHLPPERYAGQYPHQLSGGQQQRVGLARALAADPPIVLLDEPFGALDPLTRAGIRREFRELDELRRKTVVLVTHDVTEAFELADRILLLDAGRVQQLGTPRELLFRPANDFVRSFFAAERLALQLRALTLGDVFHEPNEAKLPNFNIGLPAVTETLSIANIMPPIANSGPPIANAGPQIANAGPPIANAGLSIDDVGPTIDLTRHPIDLVGLSNRNSERLNGYSALPGLNLGLVESDAELLGTGGSAKRATFTPETSVHAALETLTGLAGPVTPFMEAPFTVAQLMAAFGEALQREEEAWKR